LHFGFPTATDKLEYVHNTEIDRKNCCDSENFLVGGFGQRALVERTVEKAFQAFSSFLLLFLLSISIDDCECVGTKTKDENLIFRFGSH